MDIENEVYLEWLAAAPKGVRWDKAREMYEDYNRKRKKQAESVAKRLLGKVEIKLKRCPACYGTGGVYFCARCDGKGWVNGSQ